MKVQKTTTKRSTIRTESQLRWHMLIEQVWDDIKAHNVLPPTSLKRKFKKGIWEYFWLNLDETCIISDEGNYRVLSSKERKVTSKIMQDTRTSITILRVGSAAGCDGPIIFLVHGENIEYKSLKNLPKNYGCPPGSCVICTPTAYMTDKAWKKIVPILVRGIREMPGIRDYPEFKALLTFDG